MSQAALSSTFVEPKSSVGVLPSVYSGRARWLAALVIVMGPLLQAIEFLFDLNTNDANARVAYWATHATEASIAKTSGILAVPFLLGGFALTIALTRTHSRRLSWVAAVCLTAAMVGLGAVQGTELAAFSLVGQDNSGAMSILNGNNFGLPGVATLVMFLVDAVIGVATLTIAMWRSPLIPRISAICLVGFAILDFALGQGLIAHIVGLLGQAIVAWAVVTGYRRQAAKG